jgi:uncharacterized protein with FMN-binding domain
LSVYAAGFVRTRAAAEKFAGESNDRRPASPRPVAVVPIQQPRDTTTAPTVRAVTAHPKAKPAPIHVETPAPVADSSPPAVAAPVDTAQPPAKPSGAYKDGTYSGWGTSRHGDIQATVSIKDGKIIYASVTECRTQYSCSWISALPPQVVARQSPEVDYVSGATQSTNAFYYAVVEALKQAK